MRRPVYRQGIRIGFDGQPARSCVMRPLIPKYEMLPPSDDSHRTPKHKAFTTASLTDRERQSG